MTKAEVDLVKMSRRRILGGVVVGVAVADGIGTSGRRATAQTDTGRRFSYPIGEPGAVLGDGFFIRDAFTVENTWYLPGYWHTGEDWYRNERDTAGASVCAIGSGHVVYTGGNYPGLVVIVGHDGGIFSMYGHLDPDNRLAVGDEVARGTLVGQVLARTDGIPSHLHFEVRTFVENAEVNGDAPRYGFACGPDCPPGPGYWPIAAPELPVDLGWLLPVHVIAGRGAVDIARAGLDVVVASPPSRASTTVWSGPPLGGGRVATGELALVPGESFRLRSVWTGPEAPSITSAEAYQVWYEIEIEDGGRGWVQAIVADATETGSDGRAAGVRFDLLPDVVAPTEGLAKQGN